MHCSLRVIEDHRITAFRTPDFSQSAHSGSCLRHRASIGACRPLTGPPHVLSRSFRRFFFSFSLGLIATPSSQASTLPIVIVCSSSGALTVIVSRRVSSGPCVLKTSVSLRLKEQ